MRRHLVFRASAAVCVILTTILATPRVIAQSPTAPSADALMESAKTEAKKGNRAIWVDFGASWCGWCHKLEAFLNDPTVNPIITKHYVVVNVTVMESKDKKALENAGGEPLMKQLGGAGAGLPFYAFLDADGTRVANSMAMPNGGNIGFPANAIELQAFTALLDKTAPALTSADRVVLMEYLNRVVPKK
jgi:hypothetical protein